MKSILDKIAEFNRFGSVLGLERMSELMRLLGNPQDSLKVIHVAGTNGKGSVCKYIYEILRANGYKVGIYTSPYIDMFNERIEFDGYSISNSDLEYYGEKVISASEKMIENGFDSPTEFEIVTAIGFLYFVSKKTDFVVLEVGLGGRGDSTNIIKKPLVTAITSISYDHTDRLGNTLAEIAREKAGIIKEGVPIICNVPDKEGAVEIARIAYKKNAILYDASKAQKSDIRIENKKQLFSAEILGIQYKDLCLSMLGEHQVENAVVALTAIEILRKNSIITISKTRLYDGIERAFQKGRFEIIEKEKPYVLDGAHNPDGMESLIKAMDDVFYKKRVLTVIGILKDKDKKDFLKMIGYLGEDFIATEPDNIRKLNAEILCDKLKAMGKTCVATKNIKDAISLTREKVCDYDVVLCVGSLYMIGAIRRELNCGKC